MTAVGYCSVCSQVHDLEDSAKCAGPPKKRAAPVSVFKEPTSVSAATRTKIEARAQQISDKCLEIATFLLEKNASYGDSALSPLRIFSTLDPRQQLYVRIDDKLSRLANMRGAFGENEVRDLIGYLILLEIAEEELAL
jgi:hypothetical protein